MPIVNANGIDLYYETAGSASDPPVVFAHSVGCSIDIWDAQFAALSDRFHCIRYDLRSHGRSQPVDAATTVDDLAADLAALLDALGIDSTHIVGLSIGGMLGQAFAVSWPERVQSLALIATTAHLPPPEFWQTRAETVRAEGMAAVVELVLPRWFTTPYRERQPEVIDGFRQRFLATDPAGYGRCCEAIGKMDLRDRIGAIRAPTLIIVGTEDPATTPAMAEDLRQRIKGAEMVVVSDASHIISVEKADMVTGLLSAFLGGHVQKEPASAFARGLSVRRAVLGDEHVDQSLDKAGVFGMPWQDFITRYAWGEIWGDDTLPRKTRSLVTLATMIALHREEEFKLHVQPALKNGMTIGELQALILQAAVYAGVPAANAAMRWTRDVLGEALE